MAEDEKDLAWLNIKIDQLNEINDKKISELERINGEYGKAIDSLADKNEKLEKRIDDIEIPNDLDFATLVGDITQLSIKHDLVIKELQNLNIWRRKHLGKNNNTEEVLREFNEALLGKNIIGISFYKDIKKKLNGGEKTPEQDAGPASARESIDRQTEKHTLIIHEYDLDKIMNKIEEYIEPQDYESIRAIIEMFVLFDDFIAVEKVDLVKLFERGSESFYIWDPGYKESTEHKEYLEMRKKYLTEEAEK